MLKNSLHQPKFLKLGQEDKQNIIFNIKSNNLNDIDKHIIEECMLFTEAFKQQLKNSSITLQQVKKLFEVFSKKYRQYSK